MQENETVVLEYIAQEKKWVIKCYGAIAPIFSLGRHMKLFS